MEQRGTAMASQSGKANPLSSLIPGAATIGVAVVIALGITPSAPSRFTGGQSAAPPDMPTIGSIIGASASAPAATMEARKPSDKGRTELSERERTAAFGFLEFDWSTLDGVPGFDSWPLVADSSAS